MVLPSRLLLSPGAQPGQWHIKLIAGQASHLPTAGPSSPGGSPWIGLSLVTMERLMVKVFLHPQKGPEDIALRFMGEAPALCS